MGKRNELAINLSYGQRKLLEIARAVSTQAEMYLFDEPFAGLFPEIIKTVSGIIKNLRQEGKTVIIIEHNIELIRELCDYAIVMNSGNLLTQGQPEEVLRKRKSWKRIWENKQMSKEFLLQLKDVNVRYGGVELSLLRYFPQRFK